MAGQGGGGGSAAQTIGTSLLGYLAGKKGYKREREIGATASEKADPWAKQRKYYMGILGQMYGMPEGYGEAAPQAKGRSSNPAQNLLFDLMGGEPESGDYGAYLPFLGMGGGGAGTMGLLNLLGGPQATGQAAGQAAPTAANPNLGLLKMLGGL